MGTDKAARIFILFVTLCLLKVELGVLGFKEHEFKKCEDAHFCKRNRGNKLGYLFEVGVGEIINGIYSGNLFNSEDNSSALIFSLRAYSGGIVRLTVKEKDSKRFEVPDVLQNDLDSAIIPLSFVDGNVSFLTSGESYIVLESKPFTVTLLNKKGSKVLALNGEGYFNFEHRREKREGDADGLWEEQFKSHRDSKPFGPEAISLDLTFFNTSHVYGIPERASSLALKPTYGPSIQSEPYRLYNLDVFEYDHDSPFGLYGSVPFMISHAAKQSSGFFWLNAAEMWVDVIEKPPAEDSTTPPASQVLTQWITEAGILDVFLFSGPSPKTVIDSYTRVTGRSALPPMFAIGYHQCRWNYKDEADVAQVDANFDVYDMPYDVLWLDIEHTDGKKYMTWDSALFPTPQRMQEDLASRGRHMVTIVDPHVKRDEGYELHKEATKLGYYVKDRDGKDFDGWCWPGSSSYLDVVSPEIRSWWASKFSYSSYVGSTPSLHVWNDMNEPSVFNGPEVTMHKDNRHYGNAEHRELHNVYGYLYHLATQQGVLLRDDKNRKRPFVLSRALFAGTQKVGAIWTGDNTADWHHLKVSVPMILSLGLSGVAFAGADVGGFFRDPDAELMLRWYQLGTFYPFFRGHAHLDTKRREPWLFGEPYTSLIREALRLRYSLLPYIYTQFFQASVSGVPVMRPLFLEFPELTDLFAHQDSFLLGPSILVQPITAAGATTVEVLFPGSESWFHLLTGQEIPGAKEAQFHRLSVPVSLSTVLAFQRAGSIVARRDRTRRSSTQMANDPFTLVVAVSSNGEAQGEFYLDDGESFAHEQGAYIHRWFHYAVSRLFSTSVAEKGKPFATPVTIERVVFLGLPVDLKTVALSATLEKIRKKGMTKPVDLEVVVGPPLLRTGVPDNAVIVKMPAKVKIGEDWVIRLRTKG